MDDDESRSARTTAAEEVGEPVDRPVPGPRDPVDVRPPSERSVLRRLGVTAWSWLGIIGLTAVAVLALSSIAGLVVPFVVAVVLAVLLVPLVDGLERRGLPRPLGATAVLLGALLLLAGLALLTVRAVASQWSLVTADLRAGVESFTAWLVEQGVEVESPAQVVSRALELVGALASGPTGAVSGALASLAAFGVGSFVALFLLFLLLSDWHRLVAWTSSRLWVPQPVGMGVLDDVVDSLRRYYVALTISSALSSAVIAVAAWLLGLPLALTIGVVTFVTSYVPYIGAILAGVFAVLIALGAAGPVEALVLLLVVLAVQNVFQSVVQARLTGRALDLHPIVTFSATIVGAAVAGVLGATLATPVVSAAVRVVARLRAHRAAVHAAPPDTPAAPTPPVAGTGQEPPRMRSTPSSTSSSPAPNSSP